MDFLLKEPAGHFTIRAITRNPSSPASKALAAKGIEVVQADLSSLEQTTKAFEGAWGVFGVTQFYEHGYDAEQLHGKNIVEATKKAGVKHLVWSTVEGREGECQAISWKSKALIEDRVLDSGVPYTFVYIPMYYENFWTSFFAPSYNEEKGFHWSVAFLPDVPIFAFSVADLGGLVVAAFREPEKYSGMSFLFRLFGGYSELGAVLTTRSSSRRENQDCRRVPFAARPCHPVCRGDGRESESCT